MKFLLVALLAATASAKKSESSLSKPDFESASAHSSSTSDRVAHYINQARNSHHQLCGFGPWGLQIDSDVEDDKFVYEHKSASSSSSSSSPSAADVKDGVVEYIDQFYTAAVFDLSEEANADLKSCETREAALEECVATVHEGHDADTFFSFNQASKDYHGELAQQAVIYNMKCNNKYYAEQEECLNFNACAAQTGAENGVSFEEFCRCLTPPQEETFDVVFDTFIDSDPDPSMGGGKKKRGGKKPMGGCAFIPGAGSSAPVGKGPGPSKRSVTPYNGCSFPEYENYGRSDGLIVSSGTQQRVDSGYFSHYTLISFEGQDFLQEDAVITNATLVGYITSAGFPEFFNGDVNVNFEVRELLDDFEEGTCLFDGSCEDGGAQGATFQCANAVSSDAAGTPSCIDDWGNSWPVSDIPTESNAPVGETVASETVVIPLNAPYFPQPARQVTWDVTDILLNSESDGRINFALALGNAIPDFHAVFGSKELESGDYDFELIVEYY